MKLRHCQNIASNDISRSFKILHSAVNTTPLAITDYHGIRFHKCLQPTHCSLDRINNRLRAFRQSLFAINLPRRCVFAGYLSTHGI